jgi:hypothetical protein
MIREALCVGEQGITQRIAFYHLHLDITRVVPPNSIPIRKISSTERVLLLDPCQSGGGCGSRLFPP